MPSPEDSKIQTGFLDMMKRHNIPLTRENYLDLVYLGQAPQHLSAEEEDELLKYLAFIRMRKGKK